MIQADQKSGAMDEQTMPKPTRVHIVGDTAFVVGTPQRNWDEESEDAHNCDAMGCGSFSPHVLFRLPVTIELANEPDADGAVFWMPPMLTSACHNLADAATVHAVHLAMKPHNGFTQPLYTTPTAARDGEDAARYRFLKPLLLSADFAPEDYVGLTFELPAGSRVSANLDWTIDAARSQSDRSGVKG